MNVDTAGPESEEVTVRMPESMVDGIDALRLTGGFGTRGQVVAAAISEVADAE